MEPEKFYYLSQSGCVSDPTINDVRDFASVSYREQNVSPLEEVEIVHTICN